MGARSLRSSHWLTCFPIIPWATSEATGTPCHTFPRSTASHCHHDNPLKHDRRCLSRPACEKQVWQSFLLSLPPSLPPLSPSLRYLLPFSPRFVPYSELTQLWTICTACQCSTWWCAAFFFACLTMFSLKRRSTQLPRYIFKSWCLNCMPHFSCYVIRFD